MLIRRLCWLPAIALTLTAAPARASDPVAAQQLFDDGRALMSAGRYTEACAKFDESQRADPGLGTQFHLADCWQHVGRTASAWTLFREIASQAHGHGETARERVARDRAEALEPYLSKLAIDPHGAAETPGLTIRRDGAEVARDQWGVPVPLDPGTHTVAIYAPGKQPWGTGVEVPAVAGVTTVDVPPLADFADVPVAAAPARPAPAPVAPAWSPVAPYGVIPPAMAAAPAPAARTQGVTSAMPESPPDSTVVVSRGNGQRAAGWILIGAGIAALGASAYFTALYFDYRHGSNPNCPNDVCNAVGAQQRSDANNEGRAAIIMGGGGVVSLLVGGVLAATAPAPLVVTKGAGQLGTRTAAKLELEPMLDPRAGGLRLRGVW